MSNTRRRFASAALTLGLLATPLAASGQTTRYRVVRLPEIVTTQTSCVPTAVNAAGDVIGFCGAGADDAIAVLWRNGAVINLGRLSRGTFSHAYGINAAGQVVGDSNDNDPRNKAVIFGSGGPLQIDGSGGSFQSAYGITDDGRIFGNFSTVGSPGLATWEPVFWTFDAAHDRYDRNDLPRPAGTLAGFSGAFVFGASNLGVAVGQATSDLVGVRAALWQNDATHTLVLLENPAGAPAGAAFGISAAGHIAGMSFGATQPEHGVLWMNDAAHSPVVLAPLPGDLSSRAFAVNAAGVAVGASFASGGLGRGFVFHDGSSRELTNLLDAGSAGWAINEPAGINDAGQIVATATFDGVRHPVLLAPFTPGPIETVTLGSSVASPQQTGTSITFTAAATGGAAPYEFRFRINDGVTTATVQDWSASASFTWTPATANPNYQVIVNARSDGSTADEGEQSAVLSFPIFSLIDSVSIAANLPSPQTAGASIIFTASATGGTAPYQFKWFVDDGASRAMVQDWSPSATFSWTPATANANYAIVVWARSAGATGDVAEQSASLPFVIVRALVSTLAVTADHASPQVVGTSIAFTAAATGGTAPYEFKWFVNDGASTVMAQDWGPAAAFTWTPAAASANYAIVVWVRGAGATGDVAEQSASMPFVITRALVDALSITADRLSPQVIGTSITFTAAATGGTTPYEFKWFVNDGASSVMVQDWGPAAAFTWTPAAASANYAIVVWVRGAGATGDVAEQSASMSFVITPAVVSAVSITADRPSPQVVGTSITFAAAVTGGTAPYEYKWLVSDGVSTVVARDWSASANFVWTPATANPAYQITVWVRGAGNTTDAAEQSATASFAIVNVPVTQPPHDNRDGDKPLPGERKGKGAPDFDRGHDKDRDDKGGDARDRDDKDESKHGSESSDAVKG